jgi:molecular chaperone DnaK
VTAKDLGTGKEQSIKITAPKKLSPEEIERMVKEAEKFAQEDEKKRQEVELHNQADTLVYATEKSLKEYGDKVSAAEKENIQSKLDALKEAIKANDSDRIKRQMDELNTAAHKLAEAIYKASAQKQQSTQGQPGPQPGAESQQEGPQPKKEEDIIDADFKSEDDKQS